MKNLLIIIVCGLLMGCSLQSKEAVNTAAETVAELNADQQNSFYVDHTYPAVSETKVHFKNSVINLDLICWFKNEPNEPNFMGPKQSSTLQEVTAGKKKFRLGAMTDRRSDIRCHWKRGNRLQFDYINFEPID